MIKEERQAGAGAGRCQFLEVRQILSVETDDVAETVKVVAADLPRAVMINVVALTTSFGAGPRIGRIANMPVASPCRINMPIEPMPRCFKPQR
jgi:hypothetical protein